MQSQRHPATRLPDRVDAWHTAIDRLQIPVLEQLHAEGFPVDDHQNGLTALHELSRRDHAPFTRDRSMPRTEPWHVITWLLEHGADPNAVTADASRDTPLTMAARAREPLAIEALLGGGADPSIANGHGRTPLRYATRPSYDDTDVGAAMTILLLRHGANLGEVVWSEATVMPAVEARLRLHPDICRACAGSLAMGLSAGGELATWSAALLATCGSAS